ncbi:hypothetical protein D915_000494 [Fasciola hepatica]|uniref:Uncharacterized protein n=1 Tax=Fasciola hepatica TaxID=6192 RepID=A0A4E0RII1_FASHE|nr:hypothetical protein D915_000494 [Fasciola hepatica]
MMFVLCQDMRLKQALLFGDHLYAAVEKRCTWFNKRVNYSDSRCNWRNMRRQSMQALLVPPVMNDSAETVSPERIIERRAQLTFSVSFR